MLGLWLPDINRKFASASGAWALLERRLAKFVTEADAVFGGGSTQDGAASNGIVRAGEEEAVRATKRQRAQGCQDNEYPLTCKHIASTPHHHTSPTPAPARSTSTPH